MIVALVATVMMSAPAMAQTNSGQKKLQKQNRTEQMVKELGLSEAQATKLKALEEKYGSKMGPGKGQKPSGNASQKQCGDKQQPPQMTDAQKKEMETNRAAYEKELKEILTDEQYKTYQTNQQNRKKQGGPQKSK